MPTIMDTMSYRLTQYAHGGGCACKIPPGELEEVLRGLGPKLCAAPRDPLGELLVGLDSGGDAARRAGCVRPCRLPPCRRAQCRRPGAQIRPGGYRDRRSKSLAAQRFW